MLWRLGAVEILINRIEVEKPSIFTNIFRYTKKRVELAWPYRDGINTFMKKEQTGHEY